FLSCKGSVVFMISLLAVKKPFHLSRASFSASRRLFKRDTKEPSIYFLFNRSDTSSVNLLLSFVSSCLKSSRSLRFLRLLASSMVVLYSRFHISHNHPMRFWLHLLFQDNYRWMFLRYYCESPANKPLSLPIRL